MFYDLLVVYPMKSSVNRFYNAMSLYCIQHEFLYNWIRNHTGNLLRMLELITPIIKVSAQMYQLAGYKEILVKRSIGYSFYKNLMFI